jgi:hypothetical protein
MLVLTIVTGAVTRAGELTPFTRVKLQQLLLLGNWFHSNGVAYRYVFPQGGKEGDMVRPCDLMSQYVLREDPWCLQVHVPHGVDLLTRQERVAFVEQIARQYQAKIFGLGMIFHPAHYRGFGGDPMKEVFEADIPSLQQSADVTKVIQLRRRT